MQKNISIILGVGLAVAVVGVVVWAMGSQKKSSPTNNVAGVNTNKATAPLADHTVAMTDFAFTPNEFTAGVSQTIKVELVNRGTTAHALKFDTLDFNSGPVEVGQSKIVTFTTPSTAGRYGFHCDQADHKDQGMVGTMIVQ